MRVAILGGTRFIGRAVVSELFEAGHELLVVHRGEHEPDGLPDVPTLHVHRRRLAERRGDLDRFGPEGVIDLAAMSHGDADAALGVLDGDVRLVAVSSMDVYRAFASVWSGEATDRVPLTEDSPLRDGPLPDEDERSPGWDVEPGAYEKRDVEAAYLGRGATVCRLPMVYGEHDYQRREEFVLRRVRASRKRIPVGAGTWLFARGYVRDIAAGLRLALESDARGEVFNLSEQPTASFGIWAGEILAAAGSSAELVRVPDDQLPADLELTGTLSQHLLVDSSRARELLGWHPRPPGEGVRRSVAWHLDHPPEDPDADFGADERALAHSAGR